MGRPRTPGLEWLDSKDANQHLWARDYLRLKGYQNLFDSRISPLGPPYWNDLIRIGKEIEEEKGARELFRDMKDAWRQEKSRNKKKAEGYRPCLFTLKGSTKDNLQRMAKELDTDATALLEKLIVKAYKAHQRKHQKPSKQFLQGDRQDVSSLTTSPIEGKVPTPAEHKILPTPFLDTPAPIATTEEPKRTSQEDMEKQQSANAANRTEGSVFFQGIAPTQLELSRSVAKVNENISNLVLRKRTYAVPRTTKPALVNTGDRARESGPSSDAGISVAINPTEDEP